MSNFNYNSSQRIERSWSETVKETQALKDRNLEIRNRREALENRQRYTSYPSDSRQSAESRWADTVKITQGLKDEALAIRELQAELKREQYALHSKHYSG